MPRLDIVELVQKVAIVKIRPLHVDADVIYRGSAEWRPLRMRAAATKLRLGIVVIRAFA